MPSLRTLAMVAIILAVGYIMGQRNLLARFLPS